MVFSRVSEETDICFLGAAMPILLLKKNLISDVSDDLPYI